MSNPDYPSPPPRRGGPPPIGGPGVPPPPPPPPPPAWYTPGGQGAPGAQSGAGGYPPPPPPPPLQGAYAGFGGGASDLHAPPQRRGGGGPPPPMPGGGDGDDDDGPDAPYDPAYDAKASLDHHTDPGTPRGHDVLALAGLPAQSDLLRQAAARPGPEPNTDPSTWRRPGDSRPVKLASSFSCPSCGATVTVRAEGQSLSVVCSHCRAVIDSADPNHRILSKAKSRQKYAPLIPLGTRGKLFGSTWEVIGFMRRTDGTGVYPWFEYLLFNPWRGFRWLVNSNGHWSFVTMTKARPHPAGLPDSPLAHGADRIVLDDVTYKRFLTGAAVVSYVYGEFYWQVSTKDRVQVADFIAPPKMLSMEKDKDEIVWSVGEYVEPGVVAEAFKVSLPEPVGVFANQPNPYSRASSRILLMAMLFYSFIVLAQCTNLVVSPGRQVVAQEFRYDPAAKPPATTTTTSTPARSTTTPPTTRPLTPTTAAGTGAAGTSTPNTAPAAPDYVSKEFEVTAATTNVDIEVTAPVNNNWLAYNVVLVDTKADKNYIAQGESSYYSGTDSDGSWSEGSQSFSTTFVGVPKGRYRFEIDLDADDALKTPISFRLTAWEGVAVWQNFVLVFMALAILPIWAMMRSGSFESARWSEADSADD